MKRFQFCIWTFLLICSSHLVFAQQSKKEVLNVAHQFFEAMEKNDSLTFRNLFLPDSYNYYVQETDTVRIGSRSSARFKFTKERIIKERFRDTEVNIQVHKRIAVIWGRYDLWINDKFSHCGVDVFTLLRTKAGWKIASLAFSMENEGCK